MTHAGKRTRGKSGGSLRPAAYLIASVVALHALPSRAAGETPAEKAASSTVAKSHLGHPPNTKLEDAIVEVYLRRTQQISNGIVVYVQGDDMLVPLQELMVLLQFAVKETPTGAEGWFMQENRTFKLDVAAGSVVSDGKAHRVAAGSVRKLEGQLFVAAKELSQWMPLEFRADMRQMALQINPREITPMEQRAARAKSQRFGSIHQFRSENPRVETPYAFAQIPALEVDIGLGAGRSAGSSTFAAGSLRAFGDFMWMNGELFVTGDGRRIYDARVRLGRIDPDGGLLGPLNATKFELGDVGGAYIPLVSAGLSGRGVHVSSRPLAYVAEFDRVTIEDSVPAGHEVELYRNGILMAAQPPSATGRFRFDNVPLLRGSNEIRLEFYGPQGQRRTEVKQYFVGDMQVPVGKLNYDINVSEVGRSVFGFNNQVRFNRLYEETAIGGSARFDYGLARNLTLTGGFVAAPLPTRVKEAFGDNYRLYGTLGARTQIGNFNVGLDSAFDDQGGAAGGLSLQTSLYDWTVSGRHEQFFNGYASDASFAVAPGTRIASYKTSNSSVRADTALSNVMPGVYFNVGVIGGYTTFESLAPSWRVGLSTGVTAGPISFTNDLYYGGAIVRGNEGVFGSLHANLRLGGGVNLRATTDYDLRGQAEVDGYSVALSAPLPDRWTLGVGYAQRFDRYSDIESSKAYYASVRKKFGIAEVGLLGSYGQYDVRNSYVGPELSKNDYRVFLTLAFSTFSDQRTGATLVSSDRIARQGAIRAEAFHDRNNNGVRDAGEPLIDEAKVLYAAQRDPYYTGTKPFAPGVGAGGWTDVALDKTGMRDASMSPATRGFAVLPRPGVVSNVQLPVIAKAGIEGRASMKLGKQQRALPNVKIQVVRLATGTAPEKIVAEVATEYDGGFSLAEVPVGDYVIRIDPEQAKEIGAKATAQRNVSLTAETGVLDGVTLELDRS